MFPRGYSSGLRASIPALKPPSSCLGFLSGPPSLPLCQILSICHCPVYWHTANVDKATSDFIRPGRARICMEMDLSRPFPPHIRVELPEGQSFWQGVDYEDQPAYYSLCSHQGHEAAFCFLHCDSKNKSPTPIQEKKGSDEINPSKNKSATTGTAELLMSGHKLMVLLLQL